MIFAACLMGAALAADDAVSIELLVDLGRTHEALTRSAGHLAEHPDALGMVAGHALAVAAVGEAPELVATLVPGDSAATDLAYAVAVLNGLAEVDVHCEALSEIYERHTSGGVAWELVRHRERARAACGDRLSGDEWSRQPVGAVPAGAHGLALALRQEQGPVDAAWGEAVEAHIRAHPVDMALFVGVFDVSASGPGLVRGRVALSACSEQVVATGTLAELWAARQIRMAQGRSAADIDARAPALAAAPGWVLFGAARALGPPRAQSQLEDAIRLAVSSDTAQERLALLETLDDQLPEAGALRSRWWAHVARAEDELGHPRRALAALEAAWEAEPANGSRANAFAWDAAVKRRRLKPARVAIDGALAARAPYHATRGGPSGDPAFRWDHGHEVGAWLDTRAWLRFVEGDIEGARADLDRALLLYRSPSATVHLHAGLVAAEAGDPEAALFHLREGLSRVDARYDEPQFVELAQQRVAVLFEAHRWHPGGLEGWLSGVGEEPADTPGPPIVDLEAFSDALIAAPIALALEGMPLPDFEVEVGGSATGIQELGGWRIIDLWAPWCLPCHEQMSVLHGMVGELDEAGVELSVVVISVEEAPAANWERTLGVLSSDRWVVGWSGPDLVDLMGSPGLPTTLLVAPDGRVVRARTGWFGNLDWLRAALAEEGVWP